MPPPARRSGAYSLRALNFVALLCAACVAGTSGTTTSVRTDLELRRAAANASVTTILIAGDVLLSGGEVEISRPGQEVVVSAAAASCSGFTCPRLDAGRSSRIFNVTAGSLVVSNLRLVGCRTNLDGGCVRSTGYLRVTGVTVSGASADGNGGAFWAGGSASFASTRVENVAIGVRSFGGGAQRALPTAQQPTAVPCKPPPPRLHARIITVS